MNKHANVMTSAELRTMDDHRLRRLETATAVAIEDEPVAMLLPAALFRQLLREREILRRLAVGDLEFAARDGHTLDEVLDDCELLLEEN